MNYEVKKINELYDTILSNKKIIHEQITPGVTNMFGNSKVVFDKTSEGATPPSGWKPGYKFIIQNSTDVFSPIDGTVEQVSSNNGKFYIYLTSNGNQIYVGNLNSSDLSRGSKLKVGTKIGYVNSGSFVYVASNPQPISTLVDGSGGIMDISGAGINIFSDNNKGVNLTAKLIGQSIRAQNESTNNNRKIIYEIEVKPSEVENQYPNLIFADRTKNDKINKSLLDDINDAARSIDAKVTIDYAKTGHKPFTDNGNITRHWRNSAVDIDFIVVGDKKYVVSLENRDIVEKFTNALQSMGYNKNSETPSHPKAFLTFGFEGHSNHVHVSNTTGTSSSMLPDTEDVDENDSVDEILDKTVFKGMSPVEKAAAIEKLKTAGLWTGVAAGGIGLISLLPKISKVLKGGVENITDDSKYGGNQQVNKTAKYIGNLIRAALPF